MSAQFSLFESHTLGNDDYATAASVVIGIIQSALAGWARGENPDLTAVRPAIAAALRDYAAQIAGKTVATDQPGCPECPPGEWRMRTTVADAVVTLTKGAARCAACRTEHRPEDVEAVAPGHYRLTCRTCHRISIEIEPLAQ